jgi:hypothetical protein
MRRESIFRSVTAALLVTAAAISGYHRHRAEQAGEDEISLQEEGLTTAVALRSSGLVLMLSVVAYLVNPRWMRWSSLDLPAPLRWSGAGLGAVSLALTLWIFRTIGKNITSTVATRGARARYRRPLPLGETSPLHSRDLVLRVAWYRGGELVHGASKPFCVGDALDPATQRGGEADRTFRRRVPRLHRAHRAALVTHQARLAREPWFAAWLI